MRRVPVVSTFVDATPRKRLWVAGLALAGFVLALVVGNLTTGGGRNVGRSDLGHDFLAFYTAATFVRDGRSRHLYDLDAVRAAERSTAAANGIDLGTDFGPWWNPPFYALALEPLAAVPYRAALDAWWAIGLVAVVGAMALLMRVVVQAEASDEHPGLQSAALVPLLLVTSMPFVQAVSHGQNTLTSLLLLTAVAVLWRAGRSTAAGLVAGLLFYKPQLAAVLAVVMAIDLGWAAVGGLAVTGAGLLLVTLVALPGTLGDWLHQLPVNVRTMQLDHAYMWDRHVTLKAFWRLLLQGTAAGEAKPLTALVTTATVTAVAVGMLWAAMSARRDPARRDRLIAATVVATPLLMPFYFDYDLLLLAVPLTLYAIDPARDRRLTIAWVVLFLVLFVNAPVASRLHVVPATVAVALVAGMSIRRAVRTDAMPAAGKAPDVHPGLRLTVTAAA